MYSLIPELCCLLALQQDRCGLEHRRQGVYGHTNIQSALGSWQETTPGELLAALAETAHLPTAPNQLTTFN